MATRDKISFPLIKPSDAADSSGHRFLFKVSLWYTSICSLKTAQGSCYNTALLTGMTFTAYWRSKQRHWLIKLN